MKIVSLLFSLCLASVALAEDPAELVKLRKTWENSQAEAKKKAEEIYRSKNTKASKLYYEELYELKDNFMEAKNLQGAIAVDAEIKKLVETHGKQKFEATSPLDGIWICSYSKKTLAYTIKGDKIIDAGGGVGKVTRENGIILVEWGKWWHKMTPSSDDPDVMTGTNPHKVKLTYTRFKW